MDISNITWPYFVTLLIVNKSPVIGVSQIFCKTFCGLVFALVYFTLAECYFRVTVTSNFDIGNAISDCIAGQKFKVKTSMAILIKFFTFKF